MKNFIKDVLIFLIIMVFVTLLIQSTGGQNKSQSQNSIQENIDLIEDQINNGGIINDGQSQQTEEKITNNSNFISKIINAIAGFFTKIINFFIKLVMRIVSVFAG